MIFRYQLIFLFIIKFKCVEGDKSKLSNEVFRMISVTIILNNVYKSSNILNQKDNLIDECSTWRQGSDSKTVTVISEFL